MYAIRSYYVQVMVPAPTLTLAPISLEEPGDEDGTAVAAALEDESSPQPAELV